MPLDLRRSSYDALRFNDGNPELELSDGNYHETEDTAHHYGNEEEEEGGATIKYRHYPKISWRGYSGRSFLRWVFVVLTGVLTDLIAILILVFINYLVDFLRLKILRVIETVATETHHHDRSWSIHLFAQEEAFWYD